MPARPISLPLTMLRLALERQFGRGMPVLPHGIDNGGNQQKEEYAASICNDVNPFEGALEYPGLQGLERATKTNHRRTADEPLRNRLRRTAGNERRSREYQNVAWDMEQPFGMEPSLP
jgi:hypothetical protein